MYSWLSDALQGDATVITANRRLARVLSQHYNEQQLTAGRNAWASPEIHSWQDWLTLLLRSAVVQDALPTRINAHQSQLLWERCFLKDLPDAATGVARLVRLSRDAWQRLSDWRVTIREVARTAQTDDQRLFASVAGRYLGILERENWVDDAGLGTVVLEMLLQRQVEPSRHVTLAGFERSRPIVDGIMAALSDAGVTVNIAPVPDLAQQVELQSFSDGDSELRSAGSWSRQQLERNPGRKVAIVASNLEKDAAKKTRLVREGLVPGWQFALPAHREAVNVSYGQALSDYPAISVALLLLRWLVRDLTSSEISQLLRSPLIADDDTSGRCLLDLRIRRLPDRRWTPAMLTSLLRHGNVDEPTSQWLALVAKLTGIRREIPSRLSPAEWAIYIDDILKVANWPGQASLDSADFQLVNRWRELLNDLARLDLVSRSMDLGTALQRLELMAAETVFQPESRNAVVQLLGPLEASGAEFDAIWISGLSAANWPPSGNPSPLISLRLQRQKGMPDAEPSDTVDFALTTLQRLGRAASDVVCSFPERADDAEQTVSSLVQSLQPVVSAPQQDPGWHATASAGTRIANVADDPVPATTPAENIAGGAATIQRQMTDPISAFIVGRLGVSILQPQASGLTASVRGSILHDALYRLYAELPSRSTLSNWSAAERSERIQRALDGAFHRHESHSDDVLLQLMQLERQRMANLLQRFIDVDSDREDFSVASVEEEMAFSEAGIDMTLRADRVDVVGAGELVVLDYKSGARKRFLDSRGEPREIQLVAYACAIEQTIAALALVNIDSREIVFDGAGRGFGRAEENWNDALAQWKADVRLACEQLSRGDVRINAAQNVTDARALNLLSRFTELSRDEL
ncbi:MAG: PD-(D/E)XK nuclease family protein [Gammaproteobacteria bacterium]|nr:PD-(D/E)XK nuclease family protein [Gammaproteobacteria bacterium]